MKKLVLAILAASALVWAGCSTPVTGLALNKTATTIMVGGSELLTATVSPADATNQALAWTSSDPAVAAVSEAGLVTAGRAGTATVTATSAKGDFTASCAVTVTTFFAGVGKNDWSPCYWEGPAFHPLIEGLPEYDEAYALSPVYVNDGAPVIAGFVYNDSQEFPCIWEGGAFRRLDEGWGAALSLAVSNGVAYVCGYCEVNGEDAACYWADGTRHILGGDFHEYQWATDIAVSGDRVVLSGAFNNGTDDLPCYWEGTERRDLTGSFAGEAFATSITFDGDTPVIAGICPDPTGSYSIPCYWRGTEFRAFPGSYPDSGAAVSIEVSDGRIYACGNYYDGARSIACYWIDGEPHDLPIEGTGSAYAKTIIVSGDSFYIGGNYFDGAKDSPCYWENGVFHDLESGYSGDTEIMIGMDMG